MCAQQTQNTASEKTRKIKINVKKPLLRNNQNTSANTTSQQTGYENIVTAEQRQHMIAERAYYIAEARSFGDDKALDDWLSAETEINSLLNDDING